jgi:KDO2-lipid IV(A) lauroyltransferase
VSAGGTLPPRQADAPGLYRANMFGVGEALARIFPLRFLRGCAAVAGWLYALAHPRRVAIVAQNLRLLDARAGSTQARQVYAAFAPTMADYFHIGTRPPDEAVKIISRIDGVEHLHEAHRLGRGALVVTAHLGLFELGGLLLAQHGFSSVVLTYPEPNEALTHWRAEFRRRWKVETLEIGTDHFSFLQIADRLKRGCFVATLIDRPHPTDFTPVTLPNGRAGWSAGIFLLAAHLGVPVVPATMVRGPDGGYLAQVCPLIQVKPLESRAQTLAFYSQRVADAILPVLQRFPEQWYQFVPVEAEA